MLVKSMLSMAFLPFARPASQNRKIFTGCVSLQNRAKAWVSSGGQTKEFVKKISSSSQIQAIQENIPSLQMKKRPRKKRLEDSDLAEGNYTVTAYATAEEYDLEKLFVGLKMQNLYEPKRIVNSSDDQDVLHAVAKYQVATEPRHIFFFREGTVILWNCTDLENSNILGFLKKFEQDGYNKSLVQNEMEQMSYSYFPEDDDAAKPQMRNGNFLLTTMEDENLLEKYTFSNALSLSVKLGIWEASLDRYVDSMQFVLEDLKRGNKIRISRQEMLRKTGELFALRHLINLSSDLLDTPDFYWDREELESVYSSTCSYFSISKRTRVMNERLNHCIELADLISSNLNDIHHVRLEWMIIILIMVEVVFEIIHYADRFVG